MQIVADENIPYLTEAFSPLGEVRTVAGRDLTAADLSEADVLLVRSVSRVDRPLLEGSPVRFVGTATIGTDHVDLEWLRQQGIGFSSAPGCNAISAAEYVIASLLWLTHRLGLELEGLRVAIIGCGNVGSRVVQRLQALGLQCLINDPPRAAQDQEHDYRPLRECQEADIVCVHVPLTTTGPYPTAHLLGEAFFSGLRSGTIFLNAARGAAVDEAGLWRALAKRDDLHLLLDVWENEPRVDSRLIQRAELATPHIAGYSLDGKARGTKMIFDALRQHLGHAHDWDPTPLLPPPVIDRLHFSHSGDDWEILRQAVLCAYDPRRDDQALRRLTRHGPRTRGPDFDRLRREYPLRREFSSLKIAIPPARKRARRWLEGIGFQVLPDQSGD